MKRIILILVLTFPLFAQSPQIRWEPFALQQAPAGITAQLGRLTVPMNRDRKDSGSAEIAFVRLRAGEGRPGAPIVFLAGGPGDSGINVTRSPRGLMSFARLAELADVILLDVRGVGMSSPRPVCRGAALEPQERFAAPAAMLARMQSATRACVEEWKAKGVDVAGFTNRQNAADIEDLRKALGVPKLSLIGFSYGTHLALAVIRAHGAGVARAVLIATEGPDHTRKLPFTLDAQLGKLSLLARQDMNAQLGRILARLEKQPMRVTVTDRARNQDVDVTIGADWLRWILAKDIGDGNDVPVFPALLTTIEANDPSILSWFVQKRYNQISGGVDLMRIGMECSSAATAQRQSAIDIQARSSLFGGAANFPNPGICSAFPAVDLGDAFRGPLVSDVPVLFISGSLDSNTPPFQAEELRWGMPHATHLIVANAGHEDTMGHPEVQRAIGEYLAGKDVSSRSIALPAPRFLSVEEAKKDRKR